MARTMAEAMHMSIVADTSNNEKYLRSEYKQKCRRYLNLACEIYRETPFLSTNFGQTSKHLVNFLATVKFQYFTNFGSFPTLSKSVIAKMFMTSCPTNVKTVSYDYYLICILIGIDFCMLTRQDKFDSVQLKIYWAKSTEQNHYTRN
ncbi:hypothetical protein HELRODRAFT_175836 [Helobdella robusta]|uniref:Uncharacterized protein n=1 Tax=Helobdella robusta TaxID=6412 RepID=T1F9Q9_HELRO|nr:hypothetical protein HELRODRAFT_175836 [Helobdella robusta]ESO00415.1 hypothetical protein HELRODRAFT_175836 [Helobdella robusta]